MGGSSLWQIFGAQPEQAPVAPPQYSNEQMLEYAKGLGGDYKQFDKYKNEIVSQLRNGSYKDPYGVWQAVRNADFQAQQPQPTDQIAFPQAE